MVRIWTLIPFALIAAVGCTTARPMGQSAPPSTLDSLTTSVQKMFEPEKPPAPATEFAAQWANRLGQLPDQNGQMIPGIVGQIFLYSNVNKQLVPSVPAGDLMVYVTDATERNGAPPAKPEGWHITSDVLKTKRLIDDRYGGSIAVFLPWPPEWKGVNRLSIQARYDQPGVKDPLVCQPSTLTLDLTPAGGASAGGGLTSSTNLGAIPDPRVALRQMQQNQRQPSAPGTVQPVAWGAPLPVQQPVQPMMPQTAQPGTWVMPQQAQPMMQQQMPQMAPPGTWAMPGQPVQQQQSPMVWGSPVQQTIPPPDMSGQPVTPSGDLRFVIPRH